MTEITPWVPPARGAQDWDTPLNAKLAEIITVLGEHATALAEASGSVIVQSATGWASYVDSQYTSGSPLQLLTDTETLLDNDGAGTLTNVSELPSDLTELYDAENFLIPGRDGDAYIVTIDFKARPTNPNTTYIEQWIDIGEPVGDLYKRPTTFPKGANQERQVVTSTGVYTLDTWEANGGKVYVQANGPCDVYDVRFIIYRIHKAGGGGGVAIAGPTSSRPSADAVVLGASYFDTDLAKPVWSDGSDWRDATGSVVA